MIVLAGDIGGTHARLALVELGREPRIVAQRRAPSQQVASLVDLVSEFLAATSTRPQRACLGIAGPVVAGRVSGTNLPWVLDARELASALRIPALELINDFEAAAHGVLQLSAGQLLTLQAGEPDPAGVIALLGAGTGLGQAFLLRGAGGYGVLPSEGGHATFAAGDERDWALYRFLAKRYGAVSWERVLSGPGLVDCFEFVASTRAPAEQAATRQAMSQGDPAAAITRRAREADPLAREALDLFITAYGAQAGNLALTVLATGGVFLAGGIVRHIASELAEGAFLAAFRAKGRLAAVLERIPVRAVLSDEVGLLGAAVVAGRGS